MAVLATVVGALLLLIVLWDAFETVVLPRTVTRRLRLARLFYFYLGKFWKLVVRPLAGGRWEAFLGAFGPLSLILLLIFWALCLILSFALIQWGIGAPLIAPEPHPGFGSYLYMSGTTFFTLGYGDVTPRTPLSRTLAVGEAGVGFGFLAIVIGYLPVIYQSFSRREVGISLLDARASSPPTATELLRRHAEAGCMEALTRLLYEWERWASDLLESHLSYPVLVYYRSQHDRESWLAALTTILDTCALVSMGFEEDAAWQKPLLWQAQLTFAMARHAVVDLALILSTDPAAPEVDRLPPEDFALVRQILQSAGIPLADGATEKRLAKLRGQYEPYINGLSRGLHLELPPWIPPTATVDNWQTSAWGHFT
ncbi:MAG TPA: potassium channel family protein [Chthonomonadaceae bacterium]|nr:potassium channel family protein [Chthonomonadaceae bacterium]